MCRRLTYQDFLNDIKSVYPLGTYEYPAEQVYVNRSTKINIFCKKGNHWFCQLPNTHLLGRGCKKCSIIRKPFEEFEQESIKKYGTKFYFPDRVYISAATKINVTCNDCKTKFSQTPASHLKSATGCYVCGMSKSGSTKRKDFDNFRGLAKSIHGERLYYDSNSYFDRKTKMLVYCVDCSQFFEKKPNSILNGAGCPYCSTHSVNPDTKGIVYAIILQGKTYIGITTKSFKRRLYQHESAAILGSTSPLHIAIRENGFECFLKYIIKEAQAHELPMLEEFYINKSGSYYPDGFNVGKPGTGMHLKRMVSD